MNKTLTSQLRHYYKQICSLIPSRYPHRQEILSSIHQDIDSYAAEHPDSTYEDIIRHFGTAEDMALSFATLLSPEDVMKTSIQTKKRNTAIILFIIVSFFLLCGMLCHVYWISQHTIVQIEEKTVIYPEMEPDRQDSVPD